VRPNISLASLRGTAASSVVEVPRQLCGRRVRGANAIMPEWIRWNLFPLSNTWYVLRIVELSEDSYPAKPKPAPRCYESTSNVTLIIEWAPVSSCVISPCANSRRRG
jgi:hypothetical protein